MAGVRDVGAVPVRVQRSKGARVWVQRAGMCAMVKVGVGGKITAMQGRGGDAYLQPVAIGSDQFSWNHCTCCEPGAVSVRRMRWRRGVEMVGGGMGSFDIFAFLSPSPSA